MKIRLMALLCLFLATASSTDALAKYEFKRWGFGITGGYGTGSGIFGDSFFDFDGDLDESYQFFGVNGQISYFFSPRAGARLTGGIDRYFQTDSGAGTLPNLELAGLFHFIRAPGLFDPYLVIGIGLPRLPHGGFGNRFRVAEHVSAYVEALGSSMSLIFDIRVEARAGMTFHF